MNQLWNTVESKGNVVQLLRSRELREDKAKAVKRCCHFMGPLVKRLDLDYYLEGHQGCVNCLQWSKDGRILASGSDDTHVRVWDPFARKCLHVVPTKHVGNIFSVKFVGESLVATGAGDCRVIVQPIEDTNRQVIIDCVCHSGRVKRMATAPDQPSLFWSAGEEGLCIQYDLREPHECSKFGTVFVDLSHMSELKCIAVNPTKPHLVALGANDSYVRVYDRRLIKTSKVKLGNSHLASRKRSPEDSPDPNCVQYFAPGHLAKDNGGEHNYKLAVTYVSFDSTGNKLLVNLGGEHIYLYDMNNNRHTNQMRRPECLPAIDNRQSSPMKSCCYADIQKPNTHVNLHEHNYTFSDSNPCACDYIERAIRMYKRRWIGDVYAAARDYLYVIQHWPRNETAYLGLIECLISLQWPDEAKAWLKDYKQLFPNRGISDEIKLKDLQDSIDNVASDKHLVQHEVVSDDEWNLRLNSMDFERRYIGHCNTTTDIKEASFMGDDGSFICAGSDDGMIFIWDTKTTNLLRALRGDVSIVNCVQPHPSMCCVASSGIDPVVKMWLPQNEDDANYVNGHAINDPWLALKANQERLAVNPFETMLINMGYRPETGSMDISITPTQASSCRTS